MEAFPVTAACLLFYIACCAIALVIGIVYRKNFFLLRHFYLIPVSGLLQALLVAYVSLSDTDPLWRQSVFRTGINWVLLIQLVVIYLYFMKVFKSYGLKEQFFVFRIVCYVFLIFSSYFFMLKFIFSHPYHLLSAIYVLIPSLWHLALFYKRPGVNMVEQPGFRITIGLIFYSSCCIAPFAFSGSVAADANFEPEMWLYNIHFLCFGVWCLFISWAYFSKKTHLSAVEKQPDLLAAYGQV